MLNVVIELLPGGIEAFKKQLAKVDIWNTSDLAAVSNYSWYGKFSSFLTNETSIRSGRLEGHKRIDGAVALVRKVFEQAEPLLEMGPTDTRLSVGSPCSPTEERLLDVQSALSMMLLTFGSQKLSMEHRSVISKARDALERSKR